MYRKNGIRLYHPKEAQVMKQVFKKAKMTHYADHKILKELMWDAVQNVRQEILNEQQEQN